MVFGFGKKKDDKKKEPVADKKSSQPAYVTPPVATEAQKNAAIRSSQAAASNPLGGYSPLTPAPNGVSGAPKAKPSIPTKPLPMAPVAVSTPKAVTNPIEAGRSPSKPAVLENQSSGDDILKSGNGSAISTPISTPEGSPIAISPLKKKEHSSGSEGLASDKGYSSNDDFAAVSKSTAPSPIAPAPKPKLPTKLEELTPEQMALFMELEATGDELSVMESSKQLGAQHKIRKERAEQKGDKAIEEGDSVIKFLKNINRGYLKYSAMNDAQIEALGHDVLKKDLITDINSIAKLRAGCAILSEKREQIQEATVELAKEHPLFENVDFSVPNIFGVISKHIKILQSSHDFKPDRDITKIIGYIDENKRFEADQKEIEQQDRGAVSEHTDAPCDRAATFLAANRGSKKR